METVGGSASTDLVSLAGGFLHDETELTVGDSWGLGS